MKAKARINSNSNTDTAATPVFAAKPGRVVFNEPGVVG